MAAKKKQKQKQQPQQQMMIEWDIGPTEMVARLSEEGIGVSIDNLKMRLSRRRRRGRPIDRIDR